MNMKYNKDKKKSDFKWRFIQNKMQAARRVNDLKDILFKWIIIIYQHSVYKLIKILTGHFT